MTLFSCRSVPLWSQLTTRIPWVDLSPFRARNSRAQQQIAAGGHLDKLSYCSDGKNVNYNLGHTSPLDWVQCMGAIRRFLCSNAPLLLGKCSHIGDLYCNLLSICLILIIAIFSSQQSSTSKYTLWNICIFFGSSWKYKSWSRSHAGGRWLKEEPLIAGWLPSPLPQFFNEFSEIAKSSAAFLLELTKAVGGNDAQQPWPSCSPSKLQNILSKEKIVGVPKCSSERERRMLYVHIMNMPCFYDYVFCSIFFRYLSIGQPK